MAIQLQGCETLPRRLRRICEGDSRLDAKLVARYQRAWRKHGLPNVVPHSGLPTTASLVAMAKRGKTRRVIENGKLIWRRPAEGLAGSPGKSGFPCDGGATRASIRALEKCERGSKETYESRGFTYQPKGVRYER